MAGERKGKTYEAITFVVLERLRKKGKLKEKIFWNKTPRGMTIEPDLVVGKDIDNPNFIFLVTHSGSAKESEKKLWRNVGELAEAKIFVNTVPRVYNLAFDSVIKENLKKIQEASFDGQLIVGDLAYGKQLQTWVDKNQKGLPKLAQDKADEIQARAIKDKVLKKLLDQLEKDLQKLIRKTRPELDQLWKMERKRKPGKAPTRKETYVRRGLSKLLIFEDLDVALRLNRRQRVALNEVPDYAFALGLAKKGIGRVSPGDPEVLNAVNLLSDQEIKSIVRLAPLDRMASWLLTLRNAAHLKYMGEYVLREYATLCGAKELRRRLELLHLNPLALAGGNNAPANWPPGTVWLFEYLLELIKSSGNSANAYGYAHLEREAAERPGMPPAGDPVYRINLPDWVHRRNKMKLPPNVLAGICTAIAERLREIPVKERKPIIDALVPGITKNILESKLLTYRMFEPLFSQLRETLKGAEKIGIRACFAEAAKLGGAAGKTTVVRQKSTLVNWQSVSDAGRDHKKKELSGRAVGLRYTWDSAKKGFVPRPGVKKLILVVDGTWRQGDLDTLIRAGWDEIYYPDQMDQLAKAIV